MTKRYSVEVWLYEPSESLDDVGGINHCMTGYRSVKAAIAGARRFMTGNPDDFVGQTVKLVAFEETYTTAQDFKYGYWQERMSVEIKVLQRTA